jgi:hypothetical protein
MKQRFRCVLNGLRVRKMQLAVLIIKAVVVLHNVALAYDPMSRQEIDEMINNEINNNAGGDENGDDGANDADALNTERRAEIINSFH